MCLQKAANSSKIWHVTFISPPPSDIATTKWTREEIENSFEIRNEVKRKKTKWNKNWALWRTKQKTKSVKIQMHTHTYIRKKRWKFLLNMPFMYVVSVFIASSVVYNLFRFVLLLLIALLRFCKCWFLVFLYLSKHLQQHQNWHHLYMHIRMGLSVCTLYSV